VHHAYRFEGPAGVGKKRTAIAFAQSLLCTAPVAGEGCGVCAACKRAGTLAHETPEVPLHPDFIWVRRGLYPPPFLSSKEATGISVEQIRKVVLGRTGYGAHEGRALVVFIEDAEELTISAANALLKTLEEPGPKVHFVLHTSRPHRLLDTLRSRTLAVRFGSLPEAVVEGLLTSHGFDASFATQAEGSVERALQLANSEVAERNRNWLRAFDQALQAPHLGPGLELTRDLPKGRQEVTALLTAYALQLANSARDPRVGEAQKAAVAYRYQKLDYALDAIEHNVNPSLAVEALLVELRS
jgi:DNA polymerase-3 subunit delta'